MMHAIIILFAYIYITYILYVHMYIRKKERELKKNVFNNKY